MTPPPKSVLISYAEPDVAIALELHSALVDLLGNESWIRELDLNGGDLLVEAISEAASDAKWFLILMSESASQSKYLKLEANFATFRAAQEFGVRIIVARLDAHPFPRQLEVALGSAFTVDLSGSADRWNEFMQIAEYIDKHIEVPRSDEVYVDRGEKQDEFSLAARRNQIIFVVGPPGFGKSSFVRNSVAERLRKRPLTIRLTRGHSTDLLCRQILKAAHCPQPASNISDQELRSAVIAGIGSRSEKYFLFLDNAEEALDASSRPLPYISDFISSLIEAGVGTHILIASSRNPDIPTSWVSCSDTLPLYGLEPKFIREQMDLLLGETERATELSATPEYAALVKLAGGHPLAAKLLTSLLKVRTPQQLMQEDELHQFELKLAQHLLQYANGAILGAPEILLLQVLAAVKEPMSMQDVLSAAELAEMGIEPVVQARTRLVDLFLIEQAGELMSLHPFLQAFFEDQLREQPDRRDRIAREVGMYSYRRAVALRSAVDPHSGSVNYHENLQASNTLMRYAVPAARLLRSVGMEDLAGSLPLEFKGTIREMVFFFYQEKRDYRQALEYADRWLRLSPHDDEILLLRARCFRNFRESTSLAEAERSLDDLSQRAHGPYFSARILREKALVREQMGDRQSAKELFNKGIQASKQYGENYIGLASLLLKEASELPEFDAKRGALSRRAVKLLEDARNYGNPFFEQVHLGLYVEALIEAGEEDKALPLLVAALSARPNDPRLNYRMAELKRKSGSLVEASQYAKVSERFGYPKIALTVANIAYEKAVAALSAGDRATSSRLLQDVLSALASFVPEYGTDQEIVDTIAAKVYRRLGQPETALARLAAYENTQNPYTIYEWSQDELLKARNSEPELGSSPLAEARLRVKRRIETLGVSHPLPEPLQNLLRILDEDGSEETKW
jgi:tetratricopeptide (TPR) repeat protein